MQTLTRREAVQIDQHLRYFRRMYRTQGDLAELLDVSVKWVSRMERGIKVPNLRFLFRVGKVLHVPVNELAADGTAKEVARGSFVLIYSGLLLALKAEL